MVWIECRFIHHPVAELPLKSCESRTTGGIVVKETQNQRIVSQRLNSVAEIGDRVEDNSVCAVIETEFLRREKIYKVLKHTATRVAVGDMGDMIRGDDPLKNGLRSS